jgi:O-glycosyl hydrolase
MLMDGNQAASFIKVLSSTLQKNNLTDVGIACCDNTGWSATATTLQQLKNAGVESLINTITSHAYTSGISGPLSTRNKVWQTEASDLSGGWSTAWYTNGASGDGWSWANNIYTGIAVGNCSGYLQWEAVQDQQTNGNKSVPDDGSFCNQNSR